MASRKKGNGYFGKTGTVSRERRSRGQLSRRQFLAGTTLTGVALTLPPWLVGCGDDDGGGSKATPTPSPTATPTPAARPREQRNLHFDFSLAPLRDLQLTVINSPSHRAAIVAHTAESRARHRQLDPALNDVPDAQLTHYIENVDLPSDALQMVWATGTHAESGEDVVAALHIHVPAAAQLRARQRAASSGLAQAQGVLNGGNNYVNPVSTAQSLVFHSPEVMNLNLDQGTTILNMIGALPCAGESNCTPFLGTLAALIAEKWPATTSGGWATLVQVIDANGKPVVNDKGQPAYRYDLDPDISDAVTMVAAEIRKAIFDDPQFTGTNWHPTQGLTVSQNDATSAEHGGIAGAAQFSLTAANPAGTTVHGVAFDSISVTNQASRTVQLQFRNSFLRYMSTYVQFANEGGDLPVANPSSDDTSRAKFLSWINSNYTVLGIPLIGNSIPQSSVQFDVPSDASIAKVYFGSLGLGGEAFSPEAIDGAVLTLVFNIGVPTILLAAGVAATGALLQQLSKQFGVGIIQILRASLPLIIGIAGGDLVNGIFGTATSGSAVPILTQLGNAILSAFFATGEGAAMLVQLAAVVISENAADFLGPLALAFRVIAVLADVAAIAQSVGESLASPAIFINQLCLTMTTTVTISKDSMDFEFPSAARNYEVTLTYDSASKLAHKMTGTIEKGRMDPIVVTFDNVPSGGMVTVDVYLTTESGCIVGRSTDSAGNPNPYGPVPGNQAAIAITIKEQLIPLLPTTQYLHDVKLEIQRDTEVYAWVPDSAPTATLVDLGTGQENALYALNGITISQITGMAGYAYRAGGQQVPFCGQTTSGIEYMVQNIFLGENPERGLKQLPCGFQDVAGIVYDRLGPASGIGRNFFLQPTPAGFYVQSIVLDATTPINIDNPLSWGVFSQGLDSLAVVPTGYVVGVNRENHQMQILELPPAAVNAAQAPQAVPYAVTKMGLGTRVGLLKAPVAVTVIDATILILEDGNKRIQAADVSGNPVMRFANGTSSVVELDKTAGVTYLDLGVEGLGYLYVLSYVNNGMTAADYRLDVYDPQGAFLNRTTGVAAARLAVDTFRNVYTLNYETIANAPTIQPSLSQWNPSTPQGCPTPPS